jgi:hypothetical protein
LSGATLNITTTTTTTTTTTSLALGRPSLKKKHRLHLSEPYIAPLPSGVVKDSRYNTYTTATSPATSFATAAASPQRYPGPSEDARPSLVDSSAASRQLQTAPRGSRRSLSPEPSSTVALPSVVFATPSSSASTRETRSTTEAPSAYYTASWGSPYQRPITQEASLDSTPLASQRQTISENSSPGISFGLEHLVPSRVAVQGRDFSPAFGLDHLLPSRIPVQPHIASPITSERLALQENTTVTQSLVQRPSRLTITRRATEDWVQQYTTGKWRSERGNWLSDESGDNKSASDQDEEEFKTPIPFTWFSGRHRRKNSAAGPLLQSQEQQQRPVSHNSFRRGHKSRESNVTLKQEDFWQFIHQADSLDMSIFASKWASPAREKPLPPPPADKQPIAYSPQRHGALPSPPSSETQRPTPPPRPRTKLAWKGKACWIALPSMAPEAYGGSKPLTLAETQSRLEQFKNAGYNVDGFDLQPWEHHDSIVSQSSGQYPDGADDAAMRQKKDFRVFVPDPQTWKSYVDDLMEQKLRALGVGLGDDLAPARPPPMSRQSPGQFQSVSPNMMHASMAGASHRSSPSISHFPTTGGGHSYSASIASPLNMPGDARGHQHRHSVFGMPGMPFGFPNQQNQHSGLTAFSPANNFSMNGISRGESPALERLKNDGGRAISPVSPYGMPSPYLPSPQPQSSDRSGQAHLRHQSVYSNFSPQPQAQRTITPTLTPGATMRSIPSLAEVPEDEEEPMQDYFAGATPQRQPRKDIELAHPSPRHNRNISDALEKEIQGSDYHLEGSFERQLQVEDDQANNSFVSQTSSTGAYVPPGKRGSIAHGVDGFAGRKELPSFTGAPAEKIPNGGLTGALQNKLTNKVKGHGSTLSVAAAEFKFQPGASFQPTLPSFSNLSNFGPPVQNYNGVQPASNINTPASTFQQGAFGAMPSSDFNFASSFPYNPATQQPVAYQAPIHPNGLSIFGDVSIPDVAQPVRRSKAVAITQPKSSPVKEKPDAEDEHGRAVQSEERQKRARVGQNDGDDVPLFAKRPSSTVPSTAEQAVDPPKEKALSLSASHGTVDPKSVSETEKEKPVVAKKEHGAKTSATIASVQDLETLEKTQHANGHKKNSSSLSALARPFEFKPQDSTSSNQRLRSPDPNKTKPDFSPSRVFSSTSEKTQVSVEDLDYAPSPEPQKHTPYPTDDQIKARFSEPTFDEIDAVMQQLNDYDEYASIQQDFASEVASPGASVIHHDPSGDCSISPLPDLSREQVKTRPAHIRRLNHGEEIPLSDWSDDLSVDEAIKLRSRSHFFDDRVDQIVGDVIDHRLAPLEKSLQMIHRAVSTMMTREPRSATHRAMSVDDSDADDEDDTLDERQPFRSVSRAQERKASQIKAAVLEVLAIQKANGSQLSSAAEIHNALMDMNTTIARIASAKLDIDDVKHIVDDSLHRMGQNLTPAPSVENVEVSQKHKREVSQLNSRLNKTLADALEQAKQRRTMEEREADTRRLLRLAEEELSLLRKTMGDKEQRIHSLENQREELEIRVDTAEITHSRDQQQLAALEAENSALESTLEEYRLSSIKWRDQVDGLTSENDAIKASLQEATALKASAAELMIQLEDSHASAKHIQRTADDAILENVALKASVTSLMSELDDSRTSAKKWKQEAEVAMSDNNDLRHSMSEMQAQIADGLSIRENMRSKLDKIHHGMVSAAEQLANEKAIWQNRNEELQKRHVILQARLEGEASIRRSMEEEVQSLRTQVHEAVTSKIQLEQLQRSTVLHEETLTALRENLNAEQIQNARLQRDLHESRESGRAEVQRTQMIMQSSIEAAEGQANIIRASLEHEIMLAKNEIENVNMVSETARERHERLLEQEADLRRDALRRVNETSSAALNELREKHAEEVKQLKLQHERSVANAYEDKQRSTAHFNDRLELSNDQVLHLRDKVAHLEERLGIARSAAQAAASAAQAAKATTPSVNASVASTSASASSRGGERDKISPQALRESILVLQEQLQERETRIERLQTQLSNLDTTAPSKLKEKEAEISWLRELLSVRNEDLNQLVDTLSQKSGKYDRDAVRDFAIRIQANLQMEQQEKERLISAAAGGSSPSLTGQALAGLTSFVGANPKAVSLAAAFGNWRKGREGARPAATVGSRDVNARSAVGAGVGRRDGRPQASASGPSTPPPPPASTNLRRTFFSSVEQQQQGLRKKKISPTTTMATNDNKTSRHQSSSNTNYPSRKADMNATVAKEEEEEEEDARLSYKAHGAIWDDGEVEEVSPMKFRRQSYDDDAQLGGDIDVSVGDVGVDVDEEEEQKQQQEKEKEEEKEQVHHSKKRSISVDVVQNQPSASLDHHHHQVAAAAAATATALVGVDRDLTVEELVGRSLASELQVM